MIPGRELGDTTRGQLRRAISNAYYDARNAGQSMDKAADAAVVAITPILQSIDANAHLRGQAEAL